MWVTEEWWQVTLMCVPNGPINVKVKNLFDVCAQGATSSPFWILGGWSQRRQKLLFSDGIFIDAQHGSHQTRPASRSLRTHKHTHTHAYTNSRIWFILSSPQHVLQQRSLLTLSASLFLCCVFFSVPNRKWATSKEKILKKHDTTRQLGH